MSEPTPRPHPKDPLHGVTLEMILTTLVERHGWYAMSQRIPVRCFQFTPSIKSSLTFLRKTPWARAKVEAWFIEEIKPAKSKSSRPDPSAPTPEKPANATP